MGMSLRILPALVDGCAFLAGLGFGITGCFFPFYAAGGAGFLSSIPNRC